MARLAAVTGATGFLGRYIVGALSSRGWQVRILARQYPVHRQFADLNLEVVPGDLSDKPALRELVRDADTVVHAAGLIKAANAAAFRAANVDGTANLVNVLNEGDPATRKLLLVSSMAAREPSLSAYAATKREAEEVVAKTAGSLRDWGIVRPCAIYGPWDKETLAIFQAARHRLFPVPRAPGARVALIHAADAAAAIANLCDHDCSGGIFELTDERVDGYTWDEIAVAAGGALGVEPLRVPLPGFALRLAGAAGAVAARLAGRIPMLTLGKAREILHSDWGSHADRQPPLNIWRPEIGIARGFEETVAWYRGQQWLAS